MSSEEKASNHGDAVIGDANDRVVNRRNILLGTSTLVAAAALTSGALAQAQKAAPATPAAGPSPAPAVATSGGKPNILVILGDDIGIANISAYSQRPDGLRDARTSTASPRRASSSSTTTANSAAPPAARRS